jgi:CO/xanthine dehydrogenase FAD-binding subunit
MIWSSIKTITHPKSLEEAVQLADGRERVLFAGGTYLVADRNSAVNTLIPITHLLTNTVTFGAAEIRIGAGATLQRLVQTFEQSSQPHLAEAVRFSCPSRNIRNQRTIGGEIAVGRPDSELLVALVALEARLDIVGGAGEQVAVGEWDGRGVIQSVTIDTGDLHALAIRRFAVIPSAAPFVVVAGAHRGRALSFAAGGDGERIQRVAVTVDRFTATWVQEVAARWAQHYPSNVYGSQDYKRTVLQVGLRRVREAL